MLLMSEENRTQNKFDRGYWVNRRAFRRLRNKARLSGKKLEQKSGVSYTTISRIERGHNRSPHWSTLEHLADALGVDVDEIVIYEDLEPEVNGGEAVTDENRRRADQFIAEEQDRHRAEEEKRDRGSSS